HTIKEQSLLGDCYNLIGNVYRQLYQNNKALQFQQACLAIRFAIQDSVGIAMTYHNIAMAHSNLDSLTPALNYAQKSLHWKAQLGKSTASTLRLMGAIHFQQFQYDSAIYFYQKALELRKTNHKRAIIYNSLAEVYLMKGERRKTQQALDSVQLLLATKEHPETELAYFMNKGKFALISGNTKDGQAAFIAYQKLRSKLYNRQVSKIAQAETKYYTAFLSAKAEHQQKENQLLAERTRIQTVLLMALGILFIVSIFALINYRRLLQAKKKAHAQVQEFNEELSAKNEEIHTQNKQLSEQKKYIENIKASLEHDLGNDLLRLREIALFPIQTTNTIHEVNAFEKLQNSLLAIVNLYSLLLDEHSTKENTQSILEDLCETMAAKYGQKEVVIKINARIAFSGTAKDRLQFRMLLEVITELLQNMFKYAFESESLNPQATIQVKRVEKGIEVNYTDNGVGFPSELVHLGSKGLLILEEVAKDQQLEFGNQNQGGAFVNLIIKEI
ncbi:MAG: tetratricopeptide repeat protein, partial [Flammeovirgaceae bacterium]